MAQSNDGLAFCTFNGSFPVLFWLRASNLKLKGTAPHPSHTYFQLMERIAMPSTDHLASKHTLLAGSSGYIFQLPSWAAGVFSPQCW